MVKGRPNMEGRRTPPLRCAKADCSRLQPCAVHPKGWQSSNTPPLTKAERKIMDSVKAQSGFRCYKCGRIDPKGQTDHIINRARGGETTLDNLQFLCKECHDRKTYKESRYGKDQKRKGTQNS